MMCIIRMAKKRRERRCFKVPEFDSSERLLVTSVPVWAYLFCARQKQGRMPRDGKGEIEIDPGKMADRKREKRENTSLKERGKERMRVMVATVCVSALTML